MHHFHSGGQQSRITLSAAGTIRFEDQNPPQPLAFPHERIANGVASDRRKFWQPSRAHGVERVLNRLALFAEQHVGHGYGVVVRPSA